MDSGAPPESIFHFTDKFPLEKFFLFAQIPAPPDG